ncbi:hypothetical protein BpHYR1_051666 [Brachionus plicatilis]|uniref:Uncharacterized protein n=1 Tax=Brachionus plicatilis TaxID=10195 RepID=A0A3M7PX28_BRAPC|nr:hypothetical protein BpHYR1_051666 [Brachionus plicatilis]
MSSFSCVVEPAHGISKVSYMEYNLNWSQSLQTKESSGVIMAKNLRIENVSKSSNASSNLWQTALVKYKLLASANFESSSSWRLKTVCM